MGRTRHVPGRVVLVAAAPQPRLDLMSSTDNRRKHKVIDPQLQFGLMLFTLLSGGVAVLIHGLLVTRAVSRLAVEGKTGEQLLEAVPGIVITDSLVTLALLTPVVLFFGRSLTLRIAGPLYRFRLHLRSVVNGEEAQPCRIRKGDLFQDLCTLLNEATEPMRAQNGYRQLEEQGEQGPTATEEVADRAA